MFDTTRRDALARNITYRLLRCDEQELIALDRMLLGIERRRDVLESFPVEPSTRDEALAMWWAGRTR